MMGGQYHTLATLPTRQRPSIPCTGYSLGLYKLSCNYMFAALTHNRLIWCSLLVSLFGPAVTNVVPLSICHIHHIYLKIRRPPLKFLCTITRSPFFPIKSDDELGKILILYWGKYGVNVNTFVVFYTKNQDITTSSTSRNYKFLRK